jgi:hypothetical protein
VIGRQREEKDCQSHRYHFLLRNELTRHLIATPLVAEVQAAAVGEVLTHA